MEVGIDYLPVVCRPSCVCSSYDRRFSFWPMICMLRTTNRRTGFPPECDTNRLQLLLAIAMHASCSERNKNVCSMRALRGGTAVFCIYTSCRLSAQKEYSRQSCHVLVLLCAHHNMVGKLSAHSSSASSTAINDNKSCVHTEVGGNKHSCEFLQSLTRLVPLCRRHEHVSGLSG